MSAQEPRIQDARPATSVKRIAPTVTLPPAEALRDFHPLHVGVLRRRCTDSAECVYDPRFPQRDAEQIFLGGELPTFDEADESSVPALFSLSSDDSGLDWFAVGHGRAPSSDQEREIFSRFNYCRYRAMRVLRDFRGKTLSIDAAREIIRWELATRRLRAEIIRMNLPLVLAMAKRTKITGVDSAEMISEGNFALLRSVDKFDCARGFKFSTYACRSILKAFSRVASRTTRYRGYFPTEFDPTLEKSDFAEQRRRGVEDECMTELRAVLGQNLAHLSEIERQVVVARFAIDEVPDNQQLPKAKTLEQVGELIGVTKERVRQIQNKALNKLKSILEENVLST